MKRLASHLPSWFSVCRGHYLKLSWRRCKLIQEGTYHSHWMCIHRRGCLTVWHVLGDIFWTVHTPKMNRCVSLCHEMGQNFPTISLDSTRLWRQTHCKTFQAECICTETDLQCNWWRHLLCLSALHQPLVLQTGTGDSFVRLCDVILLHHVIW